MLVLLCQRVRTARDQTVTRQWRRQFDDSCRSGLCQNRLTCDCTARTRRMVSGCDADDRTRCVPVEEIDVSVG